VIKTYLAKSGEVDARWQHFDADGAVLGRLASRIALVLQGKHHARYTPHVDTGDFVVVTNAAKIVLTGTKADTRVHHWHSGYLGGLRAMTAGTMRQQDPARLVRLAVRRMLPKTKLGRAMYSKLKVYAGPDHPHSAQKPVAADTAPYKTTRKSTKPTRTTKGR
jgi:large subunit ribosomal protein L13